MNLTEQEFANLLQDEIINCSMDEDNNLSVVELIRTFDNAGLMTNNSGLVITLKDGSEFHLTIVKSK